MLLIGLLRYKALIKIPNSYSVLTNVMFDYLLIVLCLDANEFFE